VLRVILAIVVSMAFSWGMIGLYRMLPEAHTLVDRARDRARGHFQFNERTGEAVKLLVTALMFTLAFWWITSCLNALSALIIG
jgi:F0F1-type ATP synthase assembly protein I